MQVTKYYPPIVRYRNTTIDIKIIIFYHSYTILSAYYLLFFSLNIQGGNHENTKRNFSFFSVDSLHD